MQIVCDVVRGGRRTVTAIQDVSRRINRLSTHLICQARNR